MFKVDLHIHTRASWCYADHMMLNRPPTHPEDIVEAAKRAGLHGIAVADHNSAQGIEEIRAAARGELVVFPGVEISARGGHVLGLFPLETEVVVLHELVTEAGFSPEQQGHGFQESPFRVTEVMEMIVRRGGLAIPSHIDRRPKGFIAAENLSLTEKREILSSPHISALEITIPFDKPLWNEGKMPGFPPRPLPCIQGSDAHAPEEVARRYIYLDIDSLDWEGLLLALREYRSRIKFPHEVE